MHLMAYTILILIVLLFSFFMYNWISADKKVQELWLKRQMLIENFREQNKEIRHGE